MCGDDVAAREDVDGDRAGPHGSAGFVLSDLAELPQRTILDEHALAGVLGVTTRTIRRMVQRHELPPAVPLAGRAVWFVGKVLAHVEAAADLAAKDADREARRTRTL